MRRGASVEERFWAKVDRSERRGCWPWTASIDRGGYGRFGKTPAHRVAYELQVGPIPEGLQLDHLCRNRACVNPAHLEPVTNAENLRRGISFAAINGRKAECIHGHPFTPENPIRKAGGRRSCRACHLERERRVYYEATPAQIEARRKRKREYMRRLAAKRRQERAA